MWRAIGLAILLLCATRQSAEAEVVKIKIERVEPFAAGATFGDSGGYERVVGAVTGELDPSDVRNAGIVGLTQAPRNARGMVEYEADLFLLRPVDPAKGNQRLLFEVVNRGRKLMLPVMLQIPMGEDGNANNPTSREDSGDGFLFRQGFTLAWAGWDADAPRANNGMAARLPALKNVVQQIRDEFVPLARGPATDKLRLSYKAAGLEQPSARLTIRQRPTDIPREIPRTQWRFADDRGVELLPPGTKPQPGVIYDMLYHATDPWVTGIGFAIQRDVVAFLRASKPDAAGTANPAGGRITHAYGFGISQSGRFLRDFLQRGFNQSLGGKKVFDGVLSHVAGIGTVFINEPFAQTNRTRTEFQDSTMPENSFPFSAARVRDPVTGKDASALRGDGFDPLMIEVNTGTEYWQKGASLLSTDPLGQKDLPLPDTTRLFLISGNQHGGRLGSPSSPGHCANPRNPHSAAPALRALLVALDAWASKGVAAPPSLIPRIADGTLVPAEKFNFPAIPGLAIVKRANPVTPRQDWVNPRPAPTPYRPLVPTVDADGNERAGLRLPDIAVPAATYTGWNMYAPPFAMDAMCDRDGSYAPFAVTDDQRAEGDKRASLRARHPTKLAFVQATRAAAATLVAQRLLLAEDVAAYVAAAESVTDF